MKHSKEEAVYENLRTWRNKKARKQGIRPFRIFSNRVLMAIVKARPKKKEELREVFGIGPVKTALYATEVLKRVK